MPSIEVNKLLIVFVLCFSNFNCECAEIAKTSYSVKESITPIIENVNNFGTLMTKHSSSLELNVCRHHIEEYKSKLQEEELWALKSRFFN